jgi:hypothetical protein
MRRMSGAAPKILEPNIRRRRWGRVARDILLLPPALLYVLIEHVFWAGAKRLLRQAARLDTVSALQIRLKKLPAAAVLPLFLIPEIFSHLGGFWATFLLVRHKWVAAMLVGLFVKGLATLLTVWIYQSCEPVLLSVKWFAWLHGQALRGRDWVAARTMPARRYARQLIRGSRSGIARRFAALRSVLARRLGVK